MPNNPLLPSRRTKMRQIRLGLATCAAILSGICAPAALATTVLQQSLSDLVKGAELVFEGTVTGSTVEPGPNGHGARTCFTFAVTDVIAGSSPGSTLSLCFSGGEIGGVQHVVSGMRYPVVGEHGIYLVESTNRAIVNPIIGWDQGHFLVQTDPVTGTDRMMTAGHRRIMGVSTTAAGPAPNAILSPDGATATGVEADDSPDLTGAMSRDDFKNRLRSLGGR